MKDYEKCKLIKMQGLRLKQCAAQRGLNQAQMSEILGYAEVSSISRIYSGDTSISDDAFAMLAELWQVRKEYLMCAGPFPNAATVNDMLAEIDAELLADFKSALQYFRNIGFEILPGVYDKSCGGADFMLNTIMDYENNESFTADVIEGLKDDKHAPGSHQPIIDYFTQYAVFKVSFQDKELGVFTVPELKKAIAHFNKISSATLTGILELVKEK